MDDLIELLNIVTKMGFIPFLIPIIYFMINNFNITDIEKKFLTNFQRLQIFLANILISFVFGSISMAFPLYNELGEENGTKLFFLLISIISLFISLYVYIMIILFEKFNPIASKMFVNYGDKEWRILRVISKSQVVLSRNGKEDEGCHGVVIYRDLKSVKEKDIKIYYELKKNKYSIFIRNISKKGSIFVIGSNILIFIVMLMIIAILKYLNYINIITLLGIFFMPILLILNMHVFYLKRVNKLRPEVLAGSTFNLD
ncbi:hypothetical protein [Bacillus cereus]|uniref:hypothetical protein n=1 Tax=Bacillus cereus TaxID=1396 RepID=UPI000BEB2E04|nr:hypothetical protein [Bacillus cereus]PDY16243.1 hypothetical protein COM76_25055 [Bacillus cereus]PEU54904.1 hypothetical protein CN414_17245 [Bacillus cereus]PEX72449.1 hypothetical protein CN457_28745 [Bacillus cereus]PFA76499.1 hypothetical protein CN406_19585 [Bacillus cereus]PFM55358.1 hypothetical protein COJ49_08035 [Bacillus cereus]